MILVLRFKNSFVIQLLDSRQDLKPSILDTVYVSSNFYVREISSSKTEIVKIL